jgi:hypothetical protein
LQNHPFLKKGDFGVRIWGEALTLTLGEEADNAFRVSGAKIGFGATFLFPF